MKKCLPFQYFLLLVIISTNLTSLNAQIATNYEVGTWAGFKTAAVSYTFDDNCSNQIPVALPIFDQYKFKMTFFAVIDWSPSWPDLLKASQNGHEIASHTVSHPTSLATLSVSAQDTELKQSQSLINSNIGNGKCLTIAYPNCNIGDRATLQKYYIAGRTCAGSIVPSTPTDFFSISSIITGSTGIQKAADFNTKVTSAKASKGWCVFLSHGIDNDGGYSPTNSSEIKTHLEYMTTNSADYWVETFGNVVKYIKERNAASLTETIINNDSLQFTLTDNLDNVIYDQPVTIRRVLPTGWLSAKVYSNNTLIPSTLVETSSNKYIMFNMVPDKGKSAIVNGNSVVTDVTEGESLNSFSIEPNPFVGETSLSYKGFFKYSITTIDGKIIETGEGDNIAIIGNQLDPGTYFIRINNTNQVFTKKIVKKN